MIKVIIAGLTLFLLVFNANADDLLEGHEAMKKGDYKSAYAHYTKSCDEKNLKGCDAIAMLYATGRGVDKDYAKAIGYYEKACEGKHAKSCHSLAIIYYQGKDVKKDISQARTFFQKGCDAGYSGSCGAIEELNTLEKNSNTSDNTEEKNLGETQDKKETGVDNKQTTSEAPIKKTSEESNKTTNNIVKAEEPSKIDTATAEKINTKINQARHAYTGADPDILKRFQVLEDMDDQLQREIYSKKDPKTIRELSIKISNFSDKLGNTLAADPTQVEATEAIKEIEKIYSPFGK